MKARQNFSSGAKWEDIVGYSRAVRVGNVIEVAGTVAARDGVILHKGNAYKQAQEIIKIAEEALAKAGAGLADVVRTRMYVTDHAYWEAVGQAHGEAFMNIKPVTTMLIVSGLVDPEMLVEIEFTAYLQPQ